MLEIAQHLAPRDVTVAFDDDVSEAMLEGLLGKESGVNAAVDDGGAALMGKASDLVAAQGIAGVHADADDVTARDRQWGQAARAIRRPGWDRPSKQELRLRQGRRAIAV